MSTRAIRFITTVLATTLLVSTVGVEMAIAAKKDKDPLEGAAQIESLRGDKYKMAKTRMADRVTRVIDDTSDQAFLDGTPAADAPDWSDIVAVHTAPTKMPAKLMEIIAEDFPVGAPNVFYGNDAAWDKGDRGVFVAVQMADKLPGDVSGQQVEIGLGTETAVPVQAGTYLDPRVGIERFSVSGLFSNGAYATGSTDVGERQPGDDIEYYNTTSGVFGFYDRRKATWFLVMPSEKRHDSVVVSVRSSTDAGDIIDRLELPGGGYFLEFADATGGFIKKPGLPPLACRSLETLGVGSGAELSDPATTLVRYTAGMDVETDAEETAQLLAPAIDIMGPVEVALTPVGSDAEPLTVDGDLAVSPQLNVVSLTFEAPAGQWHFALAGDDLLTPAGQSIIDHSTLTGTAGVLTGPGLDGFVAGDLSCAIDGSEAAPMDDLDGADDAAVAEEPVDEGAAGESEDEEAG